jgi:hypothetical protein
MASRPGDDSLRDYGIAAPHGYNATGQHVATQDPAFTSGMDGNEAGVFQTILKPDDIYTEDGIYWADLPLGQRVKFIQNSDAKEAKRELQTIGRMIKKDPLSPVGAYMRNMVIPGAGLLLEGYVFIFAMLVSEWRLMPE